jgi:hypothetical protein
MSQKSTYFGLPGHPYLKHAQKLVNRHVISDDRKWIQRQVLDKQRIIIVAFTLNVYANEVLVEVS